MEVGLTPASEREERVNEGINAYLAGPKAGRQLDPDAWLRRYSDLEPESTCVFDDKSHFEWFVNSFRAAPSRTTSPPTPTIPVSPTFCNVMQIPRFPPTGSEIVSCLQNFL
jgi:hypothetical protein